MSSALLAVRYPDGTIRFGCYHGTNDLACARLYESSHNYSQAKADNSDYDHGAGEPVEVATTYGSGMTWTATATRTHLTSRHDPWESEIVFGVPSWWKEATWFAQNDEAPAPKGGHDPSNG